MVTQTYSLDNALIGCDFRSKQQVMQDIAAHFNHKFQWAEDYVFEDRVIKKYNSAKSIQIFLKYYNSIPAPDRHCYEIVQNTFYMYFDLDLHIETITDKINEKALYTWFDAIYDEFIKYLIALYNNKPDTISRFRKDRINFLRPHWIVTNSSSSSKLSLHLINRNVIFNNIDHLKQFYKAFKEFIFSSVSEDHPFRNCFDTSVASKNRGMRINGSSKLGSDRILKPFAEIHPYGIAQDFAFITLLLNDMVL